MTPNADEIQRALDNGHVVVMFQNGLKSYTAVSFRQRDRKGRKILQLVESPGNVEITDDFTPTKALHRLAEKMIGNIAEWEAAS